MDGDNHYLTQEEIDAFVLPQVAARRRNKPSQSDLRREARRAYDAQYLAAMNATRDKIQAVIEENKMAK